MQQQLRIIFIGIIGTYRSTVAGLVANELKANIFDLGPYYRAYYAANPGPLSDEAKSYQDRGQLVPRNLMVKIAGPELERLWRAEEPLVTPDFPRTPEQAEVMLELGLRPTHIFRFTRDLDEIRREAQLRRVCNICHKSYQLGFEGTSEATLCCGQHLVKREDDTPEAVEHRIKRDLANLEPLRAWMLKHWPEVSEQAIEITSTSKAAANVILRSLSNKEYHSR